MKTFMIGMIGGCLLAAGAAPAAEIGSSEEHLREQRAENIAYISGGIGIEERNQLKSMAAGDNLELSFALTNGHYLGGAEVWLRIMTAKSSSRRLPTALCFLPSYRPGVILSKRPRWEKPSRGRSMFRTTAQPIFSLPGRDGITSR